MKNKIRNFINNGDLRKVRFWIQLVSFVLFVYGGYLAINFGSSFPIFTCPYNQDVSATCYLISLQHQLALPSKILFSPAFIPIFIGLLTFLAWFIVLNKAWCGYMCPFGTLQDWITSLRKKIGIRFSVYTRHHFEQLSKIKYVFLTIVLLFPILIGAGVISNNWSATFCQMCPARVISPMFTGDFSQWSIDFSSKTNMILTALGISFASLFFIGSFVKKRFFCFFCPMSALHYIFANTSIVKFKKNGSKCTRCGDCYTVCDMQIKDIADDVISTNILRDDCILCLKCVAACPEDDALHFDIFNIKIFSSTREGFEKRMNVGFNIKNDGETDK
ncbi:MAG: 4Fe-4S binding protein [Sulfurovaceae bacterium]|nr:4Fe-4S binding protein [Sulfurovaceae bacterium]MDD5549121.1 4Fe-4S binding protein [Sulfurovaceae bacterium]